MNNKTLKEIQGAIDRINQIELSLLPGTEHKVNVMAWDKDGNDFTTMKCISRFLIDFDLIRPLLALEIVNLKKKLKELGYEE